MISIWSLVVQLAQLLTLSWPLTPPAIGNFHYFTLGVAAMAAATHFDPLWFVFSLCT